MTYGVNPPFRWGLPWNSISTIDEHSSVGPFSGSTFGSNVYPTANLAIYVPIRVRWAVVAKKVWYASQSTGTGNIDIGIYNRTGTRLVNTGATAKLAAADVGVIDITDTALRPDLYYMAIVDGTATATYHSWSPQAPRAAGMGVRTEALGSVALPATATWVLNQTLGFVPALGILLETTIV